MSTGLNGLTAEKHAERPFIARMLHTIPVPIILFWLAIAVILSSSSRRWKRSAKSGRYR